MENKYKNEPIYKTIGEVAKELDLIDKKTGQLKTHTIRYWETQFKQIKPMIKAGNRRYYSKQNFKIISLIKFLLKEQGLTINGAKKILNKPESLTLDDKAKLGIYKPLPGRVKVVKDKVKKISKIIKELKEYK